MAVREFGPCEKCGWESVGVGYHGSINDCTPLGSHDPCWYWKHEMRDHFRVTCQRCHYARAEAVDR